MNILKQALKDLASRFGVIYEEDFRGSYYLAEDGSILFLDHNTTLNQIYVFINQYGEQPCRT
tara:strand:- start:309 stop:494 length:186 start_codon:yes stop_codon:yes gene_type:complete